MSAAQFLDWPTLPLGSLLTDIQPGFASGKHNSTGEGLPHFRPMNVSPDGRIDRSVLKYVDPSTSGRSDLRLRRGDILFNNTNSPELVGKTALFDEDDEPAFSNHMTRLRTDPRLDPGYLALRLHVAWRQGYFAEHCKNHVSQASVGRDVLRAFSIELPSPEVQRAIASLGRNVDSHRLSSGNHLRAAQRTVERFRQAVLAAACSGRLTTDWRRTNGPAGQSATETIEHANMPGVPATWKYRRLDEITAPDTAISYGIVLPGPEVPDGVPYVRQQDVAGGAVLVHQLRRTSPEIAAKHERSSLRQGDVLLCIIRNLRVAVVPPGVDGANITQGMVRIRPGTDVVGQYLAAYLESPHVQRWMKDQYIGLAMPRINVADARAIPIPLPPFDEQVQIVSRLGSLLGLADNLQTRLTMAAARVDHISQAVLAKAFRGELTPASASEVRGEPATEVTP